MSAPAEQDIQGIAVQPASNLKPEDPTLKDKIRTVEDPFFGEDIPKPEGDPYDILLKPWLERDSRQCDVWKDEVQNILIFAGLFSAVVTAFIIESYQKLQADPNDQIVALLARISDQLANSTTPSIPNTNTPFTPSRSDVRVNIFWFISLVLSLTVALVGIITLQWLREHQHYDSGIKPMQAYAVFNARSESLQRWYVPQIFALLPLLLQSALVLFFTGLVDFLFAIQLDVAIPVAVSLSIPILFLVITTLLPTLQLYALEFPHLLSVNYRVPALCPYKSPQSLISRRVATLSQTVFRVCAYIFAAVYAPFVYVTRFFVTVDKPPYKKLAPFHGDIDGGFKQLRSELRIYAGSWMLLDMIWLAIRTSYATIVRTPDDFHEAHRRDPFFASLSLVNSDGFYDCVQGMLRNAHFGDSNSPDALHHCRVTLVENQLEIWDRTVREIQPGNLEDRTLLMRGRCMAIMEILAPQNPYYYLPKSYLQTKPGEILPDGMVLRNAYCAVLMDLTESGDDYVDPTISRNITRRWMESHMRLIIPYLLQDTQQIFDCSSIYILPYHFCMLVEGASLFRRELDLHCPAWMTNMSQQWTLVLTGIIRNSLVLSPSTFGALHVCSCVAPCGGHAEYITLRQLMGYIVLFQVREDIKYTLQLLHHYCTSTPHPIHDLPYVMIVACAYINAVASAGCAEGVVEFHTLLETLSSVCGQQAKTFSFGSVYENVPCWDGLEHALAYIHDNQTQTASNTPKHEPLENSDLPALVVQHETKAPDNV